MRRKLITFALAVLLALASLVASTPPRSAHACCGPICPPVGQPPPPC